MLLIQVLPLLYFRRLSAAVTSGRVILWRWGQDINMLTDDQANPAKWPTRGNMIMAMQQLVAGAQPGDSLFFHYSGTPHSRALLLFKPSRAMSGPVLSLRFVRFLPFYGEGLWAGLPCTISPGKMGLGPASCRKRDVRVSLTFLRKMRGVGCGCSPPPGRGGGRHAPPHCSWPFVFCRSHVAWSDLNHLHLVSN